MNTNELVVQYRLLDAAQAQNELTVRMSHELKKASLLPLRCSKVGAAAWIATALATGGGLVTFLYTVSSSSWNWVSAILIVAAAALAIIRVAIDYTEKRNAREQVASSLKEAEQPIEDAVWFNQLLVSGYKTRAIAAREVARQAELERAEERVVNFVAIAEDWEGRLERRIHFADEMVKAGLWSEEDGERVRAFSTTASEVGL